MAWGLLLQQQSRAALRSSGYWILKILLSRLRLRQSPAVSPSLPWSLSATADGCVCLFHRLKSLPLLPCCWKIVASISCGIQVLLVTFCLHVMTWHFQSIEKHLWRHCSPSKKDTKQTLHTWDLHIANHVKEPEQKCSFHLQAFNPCWSLPWSSLRDSAWAKSAALNSWAGWIGLILPLNWKPFPKPWQTALSGIRWQTKWILQRQERQISVLQWASFWHLMGSFGIAKPERTAWSARWRTICSGVQMCHSFWVLRGFVSISFKKGWTHSCLLDEKAFFWVEQAPKD